MQKQTHVDKKFKDKIKSRFSQIVILSAKVQKALS